MHKKLDRLILKYSMALNQKIILYRDLLRRVSKQTLMIVELIMMIKQTVFILFKMSKRAKF